MRSILILGIVLLGLNVCAQTQIGVSFNLGKRQKFDPASEGFKQAVVPSGSVFVNYRWKLSEAWKVQVGASAGSVAYKLKVIAIDTLTPSGDVSPFSDYSTLFLSGEILPRFEFQVSKKTFGLYAGGGITFYESLTPINLYNIDIGYPDGTLISVFDARMTAPANSQSPFWKAGIDYKLANAISIGVEYVHHTLSAAEGTYAFHHTRTPQSGSIRIYQRELCLKFGYMLKDRFHRRLSKAGIRP